MGVFNLVWGRVFDGIFWLFRSLTPWAGMLWISFLTGLLMLFVFKKTSDQSGIRRIKDRIKAHLLEIRLFKDNFGLTMRAQGRILLCNFRYISYSAKPMLVMIVPLILMIIQLNFWFGYQSLNPDQQALLKVKLDEAVNPLETAVLLKPDPSIVMETPPLRIHELHEIDWRFRVQEPGIHRLALTINGRTIVKRVAVAQKPLAKISPLKTRSGLLQQLLYPGEPPIKGNSPVKSVEISYPSLKMEVFGLGIHWLIVYFILSVFFGFSLKGVFKVEI
ncbi:MAG: hypothetical protein ACE5LV_05765 [Candidatus Aminicenantales bacterium]